MTSEEISKLLSSHGLQEELAAAEHHRWAHWQSYLHSKCVTTEGGALLIPADLVARWENQIGTPYDDLSDNEKESDREQVRRTLRIVASTLDADYEG